MADGNQDSFARARRAVLYSRCHMKLRIIITGGTFDKHYDAVKGVLTFKESHLPAILATVRCSLPLEMEINQLIDSLEMGEEGRRSVLEACGRAEEEQIVITHGTDTMVETATMLGRAGLAKTIVLTGAMIPYAVAGSDAVFNLGCAVASAQILPHGVYIAMNGELFPWDNVRKNREEGVFERLHTNERGRENE